MDSAVGSEARAGWEVVFGYLLFRLFLGCAHPMNIVIVIEQPKPHPMNIVIVIEQPKHND